MALLLAQGLILAAITSYPTAGDRGLVKPPSIERAPRVEAALDRGPIVEIIVRCSDGIAILSYSKVERLYCTPKHQCQRSMALTVSRSCASVGGFN
jgi:hypothetical protein